MMQAVESPDTRALHALKCIVLSPEDTEVKVECFKFDTVDSAGMPHARSPESNRAPWVTCFKLEEDSDDQPIRQVGSWTDVLGPHTQEEPFLINYIHPDNQLPCHDPVLITGPPCVYIIAFNGTDKCIGKMTAHLHRVLKYIDMQALLPVTRLEGQLLGCRKPTVFILLGNNGGQQDLKGDLQSETEKYRQINIRITEELPLNRANLHASTLELRMEYLGYLSVFAEQEAVSFGELNKKIQNEPSLLNALNTCHKLGFVYFKIPRDMETNDAIVFTQPRCLYDLLRPVAMYQQHKSEDGCSVFQLLNHCNADRPKIEQNAFGNLLADMGIAMKTNYGEHIIIATLEDHNAPVELRYCMDPLLVACKSGGCYMPDGLFWGVAHELSKKWEMKVYTPSYFQYHKRGAAIVIHVTSREHFLEIGIQQGEMNRTYLTDAEPLPQQLHKVCTEVRQTVTKQLFEVTHQLRGDRRICDAPVDQCDCDNHKNFRKHFPVGFRCSYHPNCLMQMQCHRDTGLCLECGDLRDAKTTYKQEIWFMPPKPTVQAQTRTVEIDGFPQKMLFLVETMEKAGLSMSNGPATNGGTLSEIDCGPVARVTAALMSPWNAEALVFLQEKLMCHILMTTGLNSMLQKAAGGFMTQSEAQTVTCLQGDREQVRRVITILQGKGDEQFNTFCKMLRATNYGGWADKLTREAESRQKAMEGTL